MTTGDTDRPGDPERPGGVDEAIWSELVAAFHAPWAPEVAPWPDAENLAAEPGDGADPPAGLTPEPAPAAQDDAPIEGGPLDPEQYGRIGDDPQPDAPERTPPSTGAADPGGERDGAPARVVRPALRPATTPPNRPPASVTWTGPAIGAGPRDWPTPPDAPDEEFDRFVPPEVEPLPEMDGMAKAAWLAGIGGPLYLMAATILDWGTPPWAAALCLLGGVGGFAYLVSRLKARREDDDDDPDDPPFGAVV